MAIKQPPQTYVNVDNDPGLLQQQITIAKRDGGVAVFQTTKDIYVTAVEETTTYQTVKNITNNPGGKTDGEVQFYQNGKFGADSDFKYDPVTDTLMLSRLQTAGANLGAVTNLKIAGGTTGQVLSTDGTGTLSWVTQSGGGSSTYGDSNVAAYLPVYGGNVAANVVTGASVQTIALQASGVTSLAVVQASGNVTAAKFIGDGGLLSNIQGANITGTVALATSATTAVTATSATTAGTANSVAGANVTGAVALATTATNATTAATANSVAGANVTGAVALATTATNATTASTANSVAGANVTGAVAFATTANSVAGANVSGAVALATTATSATTAATANSVAGANVTGTVALATAATTAGTVTTAAQPNITSVGTLSSLTATGITSLGDTGTPGASFMTLDASGVSLGQTGGQIISVTGAGGINIAGTGGVTVQGVLGSNIDIGGGTGGNINVASPLVVPVAQLKVSGGNPGEVLSTDGSGGLSWTAAALANKIESGTSSVDIPAADGNVAVTAGSNAWNFTTAGDLVLPGAVYTATSPVSVRGDYGFVIHPSHNTGGTGPELAISYNDGIEITPLTNDYLAGGTTAAPMYIQGAYSTTSTVVPGSVFITPGRNTTDATYGNVVIGQNGGGIVKLLGDQIRLGPVNTLSIDGGNPGDVLTTDSFSGLSWQPPAATYGDSNVAAYLPTYTGNVGAGNITLSGATSRIESAGTIAVLPAVGGTVDLGTTRLLGDITPVNAQGGNVGTAALPFFDGHFVNLIGDNIIGDGGNLANITAANITGIVANAAYAVRASEAEQIDGAYVYGEVTFAATANLVAGANVSGVVANAQHAVTTDAADFVSNAVQANITEVGTMTYLTSTGDITGAGLISTGDIQATGNAAVGNITAVNAAFTGTGSFGGNVDLAGFAVTAVADPLLPQDAATKFYVDTMVSTGISYHTAVAAATTTTLAVASTGTVTYNNGTAGVGATLTTTGTFVLIDGVNITTPGTRVLVKNETNTATNGVYTFTNATTLTRSADADEYGTADNTTLRENAYFFVSGGSMNIGTAYVCSTKGVIVFGTTAILFSQFSTSQVYSAGTGLTLTNTSFGVNPLQPTITQVGTLSTLAVTGNITGGNATVTGVVTATGNVTGGNLRTAGLVAATGNVSGGNITTAGRMVATGNVTGGNLTTTGVLSVTGNANIGNIGTATLTATGNITIAGVFTGNGSGLTDIAGANMSNFAGNVTVAAQPNITSVGTLTSLAVTGNITGGNIAITSNIAASNIALNGQIVTPNLTVTNRAVLGDVADVRITGGNATEFLTTDGLGSLSWASPLPVIGPDVTSNLDFYPLFALANTGPLAEVYTSAAGFRYNPNTGTLTTGGLEMSNIQANVGNITVVNSSSVNAGTLNGSTVNGTNVVTPTVTAKTAGIEIKALGAGDIKFTTVTGNVMMTNPTLFKNLLDPDQPQDASTKHYVDAIAQGLDPLVNARVATTGTLASITGGTVTYDNGTAGVGATLTLSQALNTLDGVTLANGDRVLVHLETDAATNGVYERTSATVLTRATDNDDNTELVKGNFVFMAEGTLYGKVGLAQTEVVTTVGTDPVTWVQFAAAPNYVAGAGIYITGAEIKVDNTGVTAGSYGGGGAIPVLSINSRGQITSASVSGISAPAGGLTGNRIHSNVFYSNLQTVGTLENLTVAGDSTLAGNIFSFGNITVANADLGNLVTANFFSGDGGLLSNLQVNINKIDNGTSELVVDPNAAIRAVINGNPVSSTNATGLDITGAITATSSVSAPDFIGRASVANTADTASQVTDAAQSNITSVGTLTALDVSGVTTLGLVGNVKITGGTNGQILRTDGTGNLAWATITATTAATVTTNAQPNITSVGTLTSLTVTGNIAGANVTGTHYGAGNNLSNIQGANVSGAVLFATTANTVAGANVTGEVASAAIANSVAGANVVGAVALSTATNAVDGANVFGQVANSIVSGTVYEAAQPAITSVGVLTGLALSGDITVSGGASPAPTFSGFSSVSAEHITATKTANLGAVANVTITGGTNGQVLASNGSGGVTWDTIPVVAGFPTLPNYADDAAATAAAGTPTLGMMYYDTTLEAVKVYKTAGWAVI